MSNGSGNWESIKKAAYGALQALRDNLPSETILSVEQEDNFIIAALKRHGAHLTTHTVDQNHLDPFKLVCWIGCAIVDYLDDPDFYQHGLVVDAVIKTLEEILVLETNYHVLVTRNDKELLRRFVMQELKGNPDHGIGFNGLFVAFHCYRSSFKQITSNTHN